MITITLEDGRKIKCPSHTEVRALAPVTKPRTGLPYIGALVNNDVTSLTYPLEVDCEVRFLTMTDPHGWPIYERTISFLLAKTVKELFPEKRLAVECSFGPGLYWSIEPDTPGRKIRGITRAQIASIEARLRALIERNIPIERKKLSFAAAVRQFEKQGQQDKLGLLKFRNPPRITMYQCEEFSDLAYGPLAAATGATASFKLIPYPPGFVLQLPAKGKPTAPAPFKDQPHLFQIFNEHKEWGRILGVNTVGRLNEVIANGEISDFIKISESLHEKKIARIADRLCADRAKVVLVSGPSSAGKTTFSKRLMIQLRVAGLRPVTLSLDNYFVNREKTPRDKAGNYDFEHIEAVDIRLFNRQLLDLIAGKEIDLPYFNFGKKRREYNGTRLRIDDDQIIIVEGIHGLNPRLTHMVPAQRKRKIYVSAMTQLSVDSHTRISTTDNRLIRRLVRDNKFRGNSALTTLRVWPSVRRGEQIWVFPFQGEADLSFNSALDYELAVLKPMVEPLLMQVKPSDREYAEARRLTAFLIHFLEIPDREVPRTSILREYIGRSGFHY